MFNSVLWWFLSEAVWEDWGGWEEAWWVNGFFLRMFS